MKNWDVTNFIAESWSIQCLKNLTLLTIMVYFPITVMCMSHFRFDVNVTPKALISLADLIPFDRTTSIRWLLSSKTINSVFVRFMTMPIESMKFWCCSREASTFAFRFSTVSAWTVTYMWLRVRKSDHDHTYLYPYILMSLLSLLWNENVWLTKAH